MAVVGVKPARPEALAAVVAVQTGVGGPSADPDPLRAVIAAGGPAGPVQQRGAEPDSGVATPDDQAVNIDGGLAAEIIGATESKVPLWRTSWSTTWRRLARRVDRCTGPRRAAVNS